MPKKAERVGSLVAQGDDFCRSVLEGLSRPRKSIPCRFLYDAAGSALFEDITRQPEYYPTKTEIAILEANVAEMLEGPFDETVLVEFGSGSSIKTEILLARMQPLHAYAPIDISQSALRNAVSRLKTRFPALDIRPIAGDFSRRIELPLQLAQKRKIGFFPGSTIGNLAPPEASRLLDAMRRTLSPIGKLIIGVDLKKSVDRLLRAYDDARGVTAAFNLNLLARANRELQATFNLSAFRHKVVYDVSEGRVAMHLVSARDQLVKVAGRNFQFRAGETIHTENAYKYTLREFDRLARAAGWTPVGAWTDDEKLFSVHELVAT